MIHLAAWIASFMFLTALACGAVYAAYMTASDILWEFRDMRKDFDALSERARLAVRLIAWIGSIGSIPFMVVAFRMVFLGHV